MPEDVKLFLCPARHDYDKQYQAFCKGNDKIVRAAARLANAGYDFMMVMIDWGNDVDVIKHMISEYPLLQQHVIWHKPLRKACLDKALSCVNAVADQFFLHAFGGIGLETLAAPKSVLISATVSEDLQQKYFGEPIPMLPCYTEEEMYQAFKLVVDESVDLQKMAIEAQIWLKKNHSKSCIENKLCEALSFCDVKRVGTV